MYFLQCECIISLLRETSLGVGTLKLLYTHTGVRQQKERKNSYFLGNFSFKCEILLKKEHEETEIERIEL